MVGMYFTFNWLGLFTSLWVQWFGFYVCGVFTGVYCVLLWFAWLVFALFGVFCFEWLFLVVGD